MQIFNRIYNILKSASLLAVVLMLAFTVPMSAHTSTVDNGLTDHHETKLDHSHDMTVMDKTSPDKTNSAHEKENSSAGCCETGVCISAALVEKLNISEIEKVHSQISSPITEMTSVGKTRLMRPPGF